MANHYENMSSVVNTDVEDSREYGDAQDFGRVAVLMGGLSTERAVSLESGAAVLSALLRQGIDAHGVDWQGDVAGQLLTEPYNHVFIALHGRGGEDGQMQGLLETLGIAFTGSGILASALSMDKVRSKRIWSALGIPTPDFMTISGPVDERDVVAELGFPLIVKPASEGSSIGVAKVQSIEELVAAVQDAQKYDRVVIAERWIAGGEYTASILHETVLPIIKIETPNQIYDYQAKYHAETTRYICPVEWQPERETALKTLAMRAFEAVGGEGWGRVDFMVDADGAPWLLEVNTVPGLTSHSLVPMSAHAAGLEFDQLALEILQTSQQRAAG